VLTIAKAKKIVLVSTDGRRLAQAKGDLVSDKSGKDGAKAMSIVEKTESELAFDRNCCQEIREHLRGGGAALRTAAAGDAMGGSAGTALRRSRMNSGATAAAMPSSVLMSEGTPMAVPPKPVISSTTRSMCFHPREKLNPVDAYLAPIVGMLFDGGFVRIAGIGARAYTFDTASCSSTAMTKERVDGQR